MCCVFIVTSPSVSSQLLCHWMLLQVRPQTLFSSPTIVKLSHSQTVLEASKQCVSQLLDSALQKWYRQNDSTVTSRYSATVHPKTGNCQSAESSLSQVLMISLPNERLNSRKVSQKNREWLSLPESCPTLKEGYCSEAHVLCGLRIRDDWNQDTWPFKILYYFVIWKKESTQKKAWKNISEVVIMSRIMCV